VFYLLFRLRKVFTELESGKEAFQEIEEQTWKNAATCAEQADMSKKLQAKTPQHCLAIHK